MKNLKDVKHFEPSEKLVQVICNKTQTVSPLFFRVLVSYQFAKIASMMRTRIKTHDRGTIPVNMYAINLATSGFGKNYSLNIIEENVTADFNEIFKEEVMPLISEKTLATLATKRAIRKDEEEEIASTILQKEFETAGEYVNSFDSGTPAAIKQMRHKLLMSGCGSLNYEMDELGSNLLANADTFSTLLELYDKGKIKPKLIKNTAESVRSEEIVGSTPTNMMMFGTPSKLFNGGKVEDLYFEMLDSGFARRSIFGFGTASDKTTTLTSAELYDRLVTNNSDAYLDELSDKLVLLADPAHFDKVLTMSRKEQELILEYKIQCEKQANKLGTHEEIRKAEVSHRYFKATKLAGAYAFIDGAFTISEDHIYSAIKMVEESGEAFCKTFTRERPYEKLAKYLGTIGKPVTHTDLMEDLPFYKGSESARREQLSLAISYGYKHNIVIKKSYESGIEFLTGTALKETNINKLVLSSSTQFGEGYKAKQYKFSDLHELTQCSGLNWINHRGKGGIRRKETMIPGFNTIAIDVDGECSAATVRGLLQDYAYHMYTTKSHQVEKNGQTTDRFRVIMPISHILKMDGDEYKAFITNLYTWLPFDMDDSVNQRERKWACHSGEYWTNEGKLLDALQFIPKTYRDDERQKFIKDTASLSNLERWFAGNTGAGNRSNNLIKYALILVDSGLDVIDIRSRVCGLNEKLQDKLPESEIDQTVMRTVATRIAKKP